MDLSFPVYQTDENGVVTIIQLSVNDTTVLAGPKVPVKDFGKVLPRLLQYMKEVPPEQWILFSKLESAMAFGASLCGEMTAITLPTSSHRSQENQHGL